MRAVHFFFPKWAVSCISTDWKWHQTGSFFNKSDFDSTGPHYWLVRPTGKLSLHFWGYRYVCKTLSKFSPFKFKRDFFTFRDNLAFQALQSNFCVFDNTGIGSLQWGAIVQQQNEGFLLCQNSYGCTVYAHVSCKTCEPLVCVFKTHRVHFLWQQLKYYELVKMSYFHTFVPKVTVFSRRKKKITMTTTLCFCTKAHKTEPIHHTHNMLPFSVERTSFKGRRTSIMFTRAL